MILVSLSGWNLGFVIFILNGSFMGIFDFSGGDVLFWVFDLIFVINSVSIV